MVLQSYWRTGWRAAASLLSLTVALTGCAKPPAPPPPPKPTIFQVHLTVAPNANPDARGRSSPVVARLFELKSLASFENADFVSLFERDKESLGNDLVTKEELVLQPGESRKFTRELHAETRFVAVVAGYRDIERSRWRASLPAPLHETTPIDISVQERDILILRK